MPRPPLAIEIERRLVSRLAKCAPAGTPSDDRLLAYTEAFDDLIDHFASYQHLLVAIKNEYDGMIQHLRSEVARVASIRGNQSTLLSARMVSEQATRDLYTAEKRELQARLSALESELQERNGQIAVQNMAIDRLRTSLAKESSERVNVLASQQLMGTEMNYLRDQLKELTLSDSARDDSMLLHKKIEHLELSLDAARLEIDKYRTQYAACVPAATYKDISLK